MSWSERSPPSAARRHAVGVSSGTDALQIAMMAEGIGRGDAVFLPAFTYTATAEVPLVLGATPVFVDVDPGSFNIDLADLERRLALVQREGRLRPRAVIGVDLYGLPADWPAIEALCAKHGMFALDDAAQAFGGALRNRRLGAWRMRRPAASTRPRRWAATATAARCSPTTPTAPSCTARCAPMARARPATRCCAPA